VNITLPLWLVISQWVLLLALGFLAITMYRQLGFLMRLKEVGTERDGLPLGEVAPSFEYTSHNGSEGTPHRFDPKGSWSLLLFADPGCVSCEESLASLERLTPKLRITARTLVATSAEPAQIAAIDAFSTTFLSIIRVRQDVPYKLYRVRATPFIYLIDPEGIISAKGTVTTEAKIRKFVEKINRSVPNLEFTR